jgi:tRNA-Thr(GGU) m(6)t(6)A37 methyltransferase TsaA
MPEMTLRMIGVVRNGLTEPPSPRSAWRTVVSGIEIEDGLADALDGIEEFSHLIVLWWMHRLNETEMPLRVHPGRRPEAPLKGIFAVRTPNRPNPIGLAVVHLVSRQDCTLRVEGLDALDGSPVIDIKPYIVASDAVSDARTPAWLSG